MKRDKSFTLINLFGLSLGISAFLYISLFVKFETSVDDFHEDKEQIYRLRTYLKWQGYDEAFPQTPPGLGTTMRDIFPEVEELTRIRPFHKKIVKVDDQVFKEEHTMGADSAFLKIFDFKLIDGEKDNLLNQPNTVVLAKSYADKYFPNKKALGKLVEIEGIPHKVTGVLEDPPLNSHINYSMLISNQGDRTLEYFEWSWIWCNLVTYAKLVEGTNPDDLEAKFPEMVKTHAGYTIKRLTPGNIDDFFEAGNKLAYSLEPLEKVYFSDQNILGPLSNRTYLNIFMLVGIFILVLAGINYINLSTAKSMKRSLEVGVRKTLGSRRGSLIAQFLAEALSYSLIAFVIVFLLSDFFGKMVADNLDIRWNLMLIDNPWAIAVGVLISIFLGLVSGAYPALYLSQFKPLKVLKGVQTIKQKSLFRSTLVILQFMISFGLVMLTFSVNSQIEYMRTMDMGINTDNTLVIKNMEHLGMSRNSFKETVKGLSTVEAAGFSSAYPSEGSREEIFRKLDGDGEDMVLGILEIEPEYLETYDIKMIEGMPFSELELNSNSPKVLINEAAAQALGFENPIGKTFMALDDSRELEIAGIVKNYNHEPTKYDISPLVLRPYFEKRPELEIGYLSVKIAPEKIQETLSSIEKTWQARNTEIPFEYFFCNDAIDKVFRKERRLSSLLDIFSLISIAIACLGLAGLAMYTVEQKTKSIGIRKVLGASVANILILLSKGYARLLILAFALVTPIIYFAISYWLNNFANKMMISWWHFAVPGIILASIALITVSGQTLRAALAKPVDSLRNE